MSILPYYDTLKTGSTSQFADNMDKIRKPYYPYYHFHFITLLFYKQKLFSFSIPLDNCYTNCYTFCMKKLINGRPMEWDDDKERINIQKHGLSFSTASKVFDDENRIEFYDEKHSADEERYIVLGLVHKVLFVVYTDRKDATRIISARLATPRERSVYYDDYQQDDL